MSIIQGLHTDIISGQHHPAIIGYGAGKITIYSTGKLSTIPVIEGQDGLGVGHISLLGIVDTPIQNNRSLAIGRMV
ncbi:MAG: hypothetical protein DDT24_00907 [Chloroflexi bacterium]|nr:hypothetical protein [Chloroflexota bacterium]